MGGAPRRGSVARGGRGGGGGRPSGAARANRLRPVRPARAAGARHPAPPLGHLVSRAPGRRVGTRLPAARPGRQADQSADPGPRLVPRGAAGRDHGPGAGRDEAHLHVRSGGGHGRRRLRGVHQAPGAMGAHRGTEPFRRFERTVRRRRGGVPDRAVPDRRRRRAPDPARNRPLHPRGARPPDHAALRSQGGARRLFLRLRPRRRRPARSHRRLRRRVAGQPLPVVREERAR